MICRLTRVKERWRQIEKKRRRRREGEEGKKRKVKYD